MYSTNEHTEKHCGRRRKRNIRTETDCEGDTVVIGTEYIRTDRQTQRTYHFTHNQMSPRSMIVLIFSVIAVISPTVHGSLTITDHEYPLMHFTKLISEEHFTAGRPLVIVLPIDPLRVALSLVNSSNKEVGYLIEELHKSGRWPILVHNFDYKMNGNMYTEIHQHGSYIILTSVPCTFWENYITGFFYQFHVLFYGNNTKHSWNPRAKFVVSVKSNCTLLDNKLISRTILKNLWNFNVMKAAVLFLKSNEHTGNDMQQNTSDSAQGTYLELHTWYPYENSDRCNPAGGTVPVKVFRVRNLSDIRRSEIFRGYIDNNFHGCPFHMHIRKLPLLVYLTGPNLYNDSNHQHFYVDEWEVELVRVIGKALNMSLHFLYPVEGNYTKIFEDIPSIFVGRFREIDSTYKNFYEHTRIYLSVRFVWYTPCAVKYQR